MTGDKDVTRRSFLTGSISVMVGATLFYRQQAACQQSKPVPTIRSIQRLQKNLTLLLKDWRRRTNFPAPCLMAKDDKPIFQKAYGLASKEFNVPNQTNTKFNVASMGKMFTGIAVHTTRGTEKTFIR